jgi:hypothetical protein
MKSNLFLTLTVAGLFASSVASGQIVPPGPPGGTTTTDTAADATDTPADSTDTAADATDTPADPVVIADPIVTPVDDPVAATDPTEEPVVTLPTDTANPEATTGAAADNAVAAVPVPGAVWLFGTGLVGLAGWSRRKK